MTSRGAIARAVGQLGLSHRDARTQPGALRQLVCCGRQGIDLRVEREASPRDARLEVALHRGNASALAPGVLRDNALLLQQNDPELKRLTRTGAPS